VTPLYVGDDHCAALCGPILVLVVHNDPHPDILQHTQNWLKRLREQAPDGSGYMVVLSSRTPPPPEPLRPIIKRVLTEFGNVVVAGAMVVEGSGFIAATIRSVLAMISMALRYRFKVFARVTEASHWLAAQIGPGSFDPRELSGAVEELKVAYAAGTVRVLE
jgi:hypothetical protein